MVKSFLMCSFAIVECWIVVGRRIEIVIAVSVNMCVGSSWCNERFHKKIRELIENIR